MQLLGVWTLNVKRIGKSLIWFMLLVVKDFDEHDVSIHLKIISYPDISNITAVPRIQIYILGIFFLMSSM